MSKNKERYYLVSYVYEHGFGNIFFKASPFLDIRDAEKEIKANGSEGAVILCINEIEKGQYQEAKDNG